MLHALYTLGRAGLRASRDLLAGRVQLPTDRVGDVLEQPDGDRFVVYRETVRQPAGGVATDGVVLVFRFHVTAPGVAEPLRALLVDPLANVATPFIVGMPGFRRKLWLAGEHSGEFLELYEWASRADAARFARVLEALLAPVAFAGVASVEVVADDTVDEYVATHAIAWEAADGRARRLRRRSSLLTAAALGVAVGIAGVLAAGVASRRDRA